MSTIEIIFLALALALDAFSVAFGASASGQVSSRRSVFRIAFHFGLFQGIMPVIGWAVGTGIAPLIKSVDHWIAFGLLALIGSRMIWRKNPESESNHTKDPSKGWTLIGLSVATSIDALAAGLTLAFASVEVWYPSLLIGLITGLLSWIGIRIGKRLHRFSERGLEIFGGIVLIAIGLRILLSHILV